MAKSRAIFKFVMLGILATIFMAACGSTDEATPQVNVITATNPPIDTPTPDSTATSTPFPTSIPLIDLPTLPPTPRQVSVSRVNDSVDPTQNLLIQAGQPVPPITLTDIDGHQYQLDQLQGKVVVINFWTLGCGSCFFEFPLLQHVRDAIPEDDVLILAVNAAELPEETRNLAIGLGATYPMIVDPQGEIFTSFFGGAVVPTTYFIAADGTVGNTIVGPMDLTILREQLRDLGVPVETLEES
jgi:thiol-disulfide isomerase/thioredoxin